MKTDVEVVEKEDKDFQRLEIKDKHKKTISISLKAFTNDKFEVDPAIVTFLKRMGELYRVYILMHVEGIPEDKHEEAKLSLEKQALVKL